MGENCRLEDVTLKLTSSGHHTLKGIIFGDTSSVTSKLRTTVVSVDNSAAVAAGSSNVYGVEANGTGTLTSASFSFNCLKGSTINVYSNGSGNKRGVIVTNSNIVTTRDLNVYVAAPTNPSTSNGSYVGVETNDPSNNLGSIQMRSTTVGSVRPTAGQNYSASDILQTTPAIVLDPTYLASSGVQIGPGTDLVTKTAGEKGFSTYVYPTTIYYGLKGNIRTSNNASGYMWPGTQAITNNSFPDPSYVYYRVQQPSIISGLSCACNIAPGGTNTITFRIFTATAIGVTPTSTLFVVTITGTNLTGFFYNASVAVNAGVYILMQISYSGGNNNNAHDISCQIDLF